MPQQALTPPWEKYSEASASAGPWERYATNVAAEATLDYQAPQAPALRRFASSATEAFGVPADIRELPGALKSLTSGPIPRALDPTGGGLNVAANIAKGTLQAHREAAQVGLDQIKQPGVWNKVIGGLKYAESGIPFIGPGLVKGGQQFESGDIAGGLGTTAGIAGQLFGASPQARANIAAARRAAVAAPGKTVRAAIAGGERTVTIAREKWQQAVKEHKQKVSDIRTANEQARGAVIEQQTLTGEGKILSQKISEDLSALETRATEAAGAAYPKVKGAVDSATIAADMQAALDVTLKGAGKVPGSITRILADNKFEPGKSTGPSIMGRTLDLSKPADLRAYNNFKEQGVFTPSEIARIEGEGAKPKDFSTLHGYYSELGRELYRSDLPGDEAAAISAARKNIMSRMEELAKSEGKFEQFQKAQKGWAILENTFRNTKASSRGGSPIARALATRDPISKELRSDFVQQILTDPKQYKLAQELLGRYKKLGVPSDKLQLMMEKVQQAKTLPSKLKSTPEPPPPATFDPTVPRRARVNKTLDFLERAANFGSLTGMTLGTAALATGHPGRAAALFAAVPLKHIAVHALERPSLTEWLVKEPLTRGIYVKGGRGIIPGAATPFEKDKKKRIAPNGR